MRKPEAAVAAILGRWSREEITLLQLLGQLQGAGWSRREVYAYLEREAEEASARQRLHNRPQLQNY